MLIALTLQLLGCIWYVKAELENHILSSQSWRFSPYPFFPIRFLRLFLHSVKPFLLPKCWSHHHELVWQSGLLAAPVTIHRPTLLFLFGCHGMVPLSKGLCLTFLPPSALCSPLLAEQPQYCCSLRALGSCKWTASIQYIYPGSLPTPARI